MEKQYGLIIPGIRKKPTLEVVQPRKTQPASIFSEESSDSDNGIGPPQLKMKKTSIAQPSAMERRMSSKMQAKALAEDATVFQYDEIYDQIDNQRDKELKIKETEPKKSKYIERLLVVAERRKLENELRIERQVQKEREQEGEEFKDKEKFVTTAYRKKLEEMRKLAEQEMHEEYLESIGDVTKQKDLDGFYRHLYEQKLGTEKTVKNPSMQEEIGETEVSYKPIKSYRTEKKRVYRKRLVSEEQQPDESKPKVHAAEAKMHLVNNMDADSDFSIDSSTSEDEDNEKGLLKTDRKISEKTACTDEVTSSSKLEETDDNEITLNVEALKNTKRVEKENVEIEDSVRQKNKEKLDIWKKRTVKELFDAAQKRYYERKVARNA